MTNAIIVNKLYLTISVGCIVLLILGTIYVASRGKRKLDNTKPTVIYSIRGLS